VRLCRDTARLGFCTRRRLRRFGARGLDVTGLIDRLALPGLAIMIAGFLIYIGHAWLRNKEDRALRITEEEDDAS